MKKKIEVGYSDFKKVVSNNNYFVDKTMLIYDLFTKGAYISLMPRPKRFGKTLNLSMIEHFFDIRKTDNAKLFADFKISNKTDFCYEHQNKYPVINISLKDIKANNWDDCYNKFKIEISDLYNKHKYLLDSNKLEKLEKENFEQILKKIAPQAQFEYSLKHLSEYLNIHFEQEVIILVDEYDAPIINAFKNTPSPIKGKKGEATYYEKIISFLQTFLGKAFKGNDDNLRKGLLTGVMRVGKESIFSEWNNFAVFGITSNYFSDRFGFTEQETLKILTYFGLQNQMSKIKKWYDGYKFGSIDQIFNPWSIVNYIAKEKDGFAPYWVNTGDTALIQERIIEPNIKEKIQDLIEGKMIERQLNDNFVFSDFETDSELIWTLLTYNGYLTQIEKSKYGNYKLKIPNNEVKIVFTDIIMSWLNTSVKIKRELLIQTTEHLINNRIGKFEKGFREIIGDTISYFDTAKITDKDDKEVFILPEQIYHVYTLGLLTILSDDYVIKSNRESFDGRYDIMLIPHDKIKNGVVIEIKQIEKQQENEDDKKFKERINNKIENALFQIDRNEYYTELIANKIKPENIIKLAIVFVGKRPYINKLPETGFEASGLFK